MIKQIFSIFAFCFLYLPLYPQDYKPLSESKKVEMSVKVTAAHNKMSSFQANFTQEKKSVLLANSVVQEGIIYYQKSNKLRWEYLKPNKLILIFNNDKTILRNEKGVVSPNKMVNQLGSLILKTINGQFITENKDFTINFFLCKDQSILIELKPVNKKIRELYKTISVTLDKDDLLATKVVLTEVNGDVTTITFSKRKLNLIIPQTLFNE